ncbi:MAG: hypothetical protein WD081_07805 [Gammaproteobacteria bacterium]
MKTSFTEVTLGALLLRQLATSVEAGADIDTAADNLRGRLPEALRARLDALLSALKAPSSERRGRSRTAFETIITFAKASSADALKSMLRLARHSERLVPLHYRVDREMGERYFYLLAVGVVVLLVVVVGNQFIAPFVANVFGDGNTAFGIVRMPWLTRVVFYNAGGLVGYLLVLALVLPALAWAKFSRDVRRSVQTLSPLPAYWSRWPTFRRSAARVNHLVLVLVADCLHAGGLSGQEALDAAAAGPLPDEPPEMLGLMLARNGGDLERELAWQTDVAGDLLWADIQVLVEQGTGIFIAIAGVVVGVIVIAIYLPIFKLGSLSFLGGMG